MSKEGVPTNEHIAEENAPRKSKDREQIYKEHLASLLDTEKLKQTREMQILTRVNDIIGSTEMAIRDKFDIVAFEIDPKRRARTDIPPLPQLKYSFDEISKSMMSWNLGSPPNTPERALIVLRAMQMPERRNMVREKVQEDYDKFRGRGYKEGSRLKVNNDGTVEDDWTISEIKDVTRSVVVERFDRMERMQVKKIIPLDEIVELNK